MAGIFGQLCNQFVLVNDRSGCFLFLRANSTDPVSLGLTADRLFNHQNLRASDRCPCRSHQAGIARADYKDLCFKGLCDLALVNLRRSSQPVDIGCTANRRNVFFYGDIAALNDFSTTCLKDAVGNRFLDRLACNGCTRHTVNGTALCFHDLLFQNRSRNAANVFCFRRGVYRDLYNTLLIKGNMYGYLTVAAHCTGCVRSGSIN